MSTNLPKTINLGGRVKLRSPSGTIGRVIELRGPLGPNGAQIYRVQLKWKPRPAYIEVREDQLDVLPETE